MNIRKFLIWLWNTDTDKLQIIVNDYDKKHGIKFTLLKMGKIIEVTTLEQYATSLRRSKDKNDS